MVDEIRQQLGFEASSALNTLKQLDSALASLENRMNANATAIANFNKVGGGFANLGRSGVTAFNNLGQAGQRNAKTISNAFDQLISVNGRYSTSLGLLSRIVFTQAVVSGFRHVKDAIADATQTALDFQKQLAEIKSIDSDKILPANIGDRLRGISSDFNIPLPTVATGAYEALSAQVLKSGNDMHFLEASAAFAKGTLTDMGSSVKGLAGALNAYGQGTENVDRIASQFNETIRLGTIRGEELANNFGTIATLGHQLGISQAELLAAVAALTNAGVPHAQAFTQIRSVLTGLVKPSEQLTKVFRQNGIASAESLLAAKGFGGALSFLRAQTDGTTAGTAELFHNQRSLLGVLAIGGQIAEFYASALRQIDGIASSINDSRAQEVMASDAEQLTQSWNKLKNSLIPLGDGLIKTANIGINTAATFRDFSVAVLDSVGSLARGVPRVTEFGRAYENLQRILGKGTTIDPTTGKPAEILNELEIRSRQLGIIARQHEEENRAELAAAANHDAELNKLRFQAVDNFRDRNLELLAEARSAGDAIINVEKQKLAELTHQINNARNLLRQSPSQIQGIQGRQERRDFDTKTSGLSDAQKSFALIQRASEQASQAATALAAAGRSGNQADIQRARTLFETAQATGEEAQSLASSADDRRGSLFAAQQLRDLTAQQVNAERTLASITAARLPSLEQQKTKQQQSLAIMQTAIQTLSKNSSLFDKQSQQLSPQQLEAQAKARAGALQSLLDQGVSKDKVLDLQIRTDGAVQKLQNDLTGALSKIDASTAAAATLTGTLQTLQPVMQGNASAAAVLAQSLERAASASSSITLPQLGGAANHAFGGRMSYFAAGGRGIDTIPAMLSPGETVINARQSGRFFSQLQAINAGQSPVFRSGGGNVNSNNVGDVSVSIKTSDPSKINGREIGRALRQEIRRGNLRL